MKALLLSLWLAAAGCGVAIANESRHSAIVDMPEVMTLTHASPDTWDTLPPVQANDCSRPEHSGRGDVECEPTAGQEQLTAVRLLWQTRKADPGHDRSDWANRIVVVAFKENDGGSARALR
jgi:hypothetical protein